MKITALSVYRVALASHETYYMAAGKTCDTVDSMVLRLDTDEGLTGWGEVCAIPHYLPAYAGGVAPAIEEVAPVLLGADPVGPEAVMARCDAWLMGHDYAKSAIDIALWDITAKAVGLPLYRLLGGRRMEAAPLYHSITCTNPEKMARIASDAYAEGIRQFQAKVGAGDDWRVDVERIRSVREAVGEGPVLIADWNAGATSCTATRVGRAVSELDVILEQPCVGLDACARVQRATGLPMKIDEDARDVDSLLYAHSLGCMEVVAIKLSKFGGLSAARRARDLCVELGTMMMVEDTWGSDIATAAALHLAISTPPEFLLNTCDLSGYVHPRIAPDGPVRHEAMLAPPEKPGLGVTPDESILGVPVLALTLD